MTDRRTETTEPPIAVTVIGGYLGAGKTTLVNQILRAADERIAVIVNDFGEINIDADLIERNDGETLALTNGCICCSLMDGFAGALTTITNLEPRPERLVIEASGVADPAQVAAYGHSPGLRLDAVVVLADVETVEHRSNDRLVGDTVTQQLDAADLIVINKTDLVDPVEVEQTIRWLQGRWPEALLVQARHARISPAVLFGVMASTERPATPPRHETNFTSWALVRDRPIDRRSIDELMNELPDSIIRAKGTVWLDDGSERASVLQRVGRRWSLTPGPPWTGEPVSQLVFIGTDPAVGDWLEAQLD